MKPSWQRNLVAFLAAVLIVPTASADAARLILDADADVWVFESNPKQNANDIPLLQAGIGRGREVGRLITYLRFDLSDVPVSTVFRTTEIARAELSLFAQSSGLAGKEDQLFVSVAGCPVTDWAEDTITWESRVCPGLTQADDMQLIGVADLPQIYRWDVTRSVAQALNANRTRVTLILSAFKVEVAPGTREIVPGRQFGPEEDVGFVRFWSRERATLSARAAPTLAVTYQREDTNLVQFAGTVIAIFSALSVAFGVWEGFPARQGRLTPLKHSPGRAPGCSNHRILPPGPRVGRQWRSSYRTIQMAACNQTKMFDPGVLRLSGRLSNLHPFDPPLRH